MTVKVEAYPEMSYHQRFPSSSNGAYKNDGVVLNGYGPDPAYTARPFHNSYRNPGFNRAPPPSKSGLPPSDPHSASFSDGLVGPRGSVLASHSASYPDGLSLRRNGSAAAPRGAPPAFVSATAAATMNRGLRRADGRGPPPTPPQTQQANGGTTTLHRPDAATRAQQGGPITLQRFPSHRHPHPHPPPPQAPHFATARRSSASQPLTNPQHLIWAASPNGNGAESGGVGGRGNGGGRATVVLRKPRSRRLLRSLLCCFGAKPAGAGGPGPPGLGLAGRESGKALDGGGGTASPYLPKPSEKLLLPPVRPADAAKKTLIIDLDETLVHSSFKPVKNADFVIPVEIDGVIHQVYVLKRPYVDEFLDRIGDLFECILFTASLAKYADPVADLLDKRGVFRARLFREACVFHKGNYVKDLNRLGRDLKRVLIVDNSPASYAFHPDNAVCSASFLGVFRASLFREACVFHKGNYVKDLNRLGRDLKRVLIVDNSPASYAFHPDNAVCSASFLGVFWASLFRKACVFHKGNYVKDLNRLGRDLKRVLIVDNSSASYAFHPDNAIPVQSWFDDMSDTELLDLLPILERMVNVDNVYTVLRNANDHP